MASECANATASAASPQRFGCVFGRSPGCKRRWKYSFAATPPSQVKNSVAKMEGFRLLTVAGAARIRLNEINPFRFPFNTGVETSAPNTLEL